MRLLVAARLLVMRNRSEPWWTPLWIAVPCLARPAPARADERA